ncbi:MULTISPECIES: T6SS immunity protein Tli3 family protein [Enterobacter cloacae complex]|uniref:T6SS immunity protein Tli3 family protein n=1 Tax=Enterobacter cloacae complex TaxID=354276 RepID=UPI0035153950
MKTLCSGIAAAAVLMASGCQAKETPTQVVYRFDDHRYLELKGWDCEGELWYTDTLKRIHSQPYSQFYRIFTKKFIHPSERYIALTSWGGGAFTVSKDFGKTWQLAQFSPGENEPNGDSSPTYDDVLSLTVVNDQGFLQTKHSLYMSSKPFDDPRLLPSGEGIHYELPDGVQGDIKPGTGGWSWGMVYMTKQGLKDTVQTLQTNWQGQPDKVPEVKDYTGWDHMRCDMDAR